MHAVDVIDKSLLGIHLMVTEETLVEFANAVIRSKVTRHDGSLRPNVLFTMLASSVFGIL